MIFFRKALSTIIGVSLLFLFSVILFLLISNWFSSYTSSLETDLEAKDFGRNFEIVLANASHLFLENEYRDDLLIEEVYVNGTNCTSSSLEIDKGPFQSYPLSETCTQSLQNGVAYDILILTSASSYSEYEIFYNLS